jgi:hypothetical protein
LTPLASNRGSETISLVARKKTRRLDRPQCNDAGWRYARAMFEVVIFKRSPTRWEWQVCDRKGNAIMRGWEHTRSAAKYRGDRSLFLLLAAANHGPRETR